MFKGRSPKATNPHLILVLGRQWGTRENYWGKVQIFRRQLPGHLENIAQTHSKDPAQSLLVTAIETSTSNSGRSRQLLRFKRRRN